MDLGFRTNCLEGIAPEMIDEIIDMSIEQQVVKAGGNNSCKLVRYKGKDYAVLKSSNIECYRLPATKEKNKDKTPNQIMESGELNLDEVMRLGAALQEHHVVPILGFSWDRSNVSEYHNERSGSQSAYAKGFIVQPKAPGKELYDGVGYVDGTNSERVERLIEYTKQYAHIPPEHFAEFVKNYMAVERVLMVDPSKRGNFFYDSEKGFYFIDLNFIQQRDYSQEQLQEHATRYIATQFRTIYEGTFNSFSPEQQQVYAQGSREIVINMAQGFLQAGIPESTIEGSLATIIDEGAIWEEAGVIQPSAVLQLAKAREEESVQ